MAFKPMIRATLAKFFGAGLRRTKGMSAERAKRLARSGDPLVRVDIADSDRTPPEILYYLSRDPDVRVRRATAGNSRTPRQADIILAMDADPEVRHLVALKINQQMSQLSKESVQLWSLTVQVMDALARDNLVAVRQLIAEAGRTIDKVPPQLMSLLGHDKASEVAVPALEYVGQIPDSDLVDIVQSNPDPRIVGAVAKRPAIGATVSEAVVTHGDDSAIAALLDNAQAAIASDTLGQVVDRAQKVERWHQALVGRQDLPDDAVIRLASFVAEKLVPVLQRRQNLDPETNAAVSLLMRQRSQPQAFQSQGSGQVAPVQASQQPQYPSDGTVETITPEFVETEGGAGRARRYFMNGALSEDIVVEALAQDREFIVVALSLRAGISEAVVAKILASNSAKGLTALAWKAGYSMRLSLQMQLRLARLPPKARLNPSTVGFPMTQKAMDWQIEFFKSLVDMG